MNVQQIEARIQQAESLAQEATRGPWDMDALIVYSESARSVVCQMSKPHTETIKHVPLSLSAPGEDWRAVRATGEFIAATRSLVPELCQDIKDLLARVNELESEKERGT